jgi:hypothetical protein
MPVAIEGKVLPPAVSPDADAGHGFVNVVRKLAHIPTAFHSEDERLAALDALTTYERSILGSAHAGVIQETDHAPVEDVSLRVPPGGAPMPVVTGPTIDYDKLAAAIVRAQLAQAEASKPVEITDVSDKAVDSNGPGADSTD